MTLLTVVLDESGCASPQVAGCRESVRLAALEAADAEIHVTSGPTSWPADGWVLMLEAADRLAPGGLAALVEAIRSHPDASIVVGDHLRPKGVLGERSHHPVWSYEYLLSAAHVECAVALRSDVLAALLPSGFDGGLRDGLPLELLLRAAEAGVAPVRCAEVVVERHGESIGVERHRSLVASHLARLGVAADIGVTDQRTLHVRRADRGRSGTVSVVIPTRGSTGTAWGRTSTWVIDAVDSITSTSSWPDLEFVVVADEATPVWVRESLEQLSGGRLRWVPWTEPFNFSAKVNRGVAESTGEVVLLLNDDTRLVDPDAIGEMVALLGSVDPATGSRVGAVGARLLFEDSTLQHAGHVYQEHPLHACVGWPGEHPGPGRRLWATRECTGVTAAALMVERSTFDEVGGFPLEFPLDFNDVWFSLAVRAAGHRVVWTPHATWFHFEGRTRERGPRPDEYAALHERWGDALDVDPYYHPDLEPRRADWLERPSSRWWSVRGARF
jgi:GT2 family glycosyltransferase